MDRYIRNGDVFISSPASSSIFGIDDHYDSETHGWSFNHTFEVARPFTVSPNFVIRPAAGFEYQNVRQDAFSERKNEGMSITWMNNGSNIADGYEAEGETSGTYAMDYKSMTFSRSLVRFGVSTESYFSRGGVRFRAYNITRVMGDRFPVSSQSFASGSSVFKTRGAELGCNFWQVGVGGHAWLNQERTATLFMNTDWNFSPLRGGYSMLNFNVGLQQSF